MIPGKQIAIGLLSTSAAAWLRQILSLILYGIAAHMLAAEEVGIFALASVIPLGIEYGFFDSISEAIVQRVTLEPGHFLLALVMAAAAASVTITAALTLSGDVADLFRVAALREVLPWMAAGVAVMILSAPYAGYLRRLARFQTLSAISGLAAVLACGTGAVLLLLGWGVWALVAYWVVEKLTLSCGYVCMAPRHPIAMFNWRQGREIVNYAWAIFGQRVLFFLRGQMDRILIGWLLTPDVLGAYQLAAKIGESVGGVLLTPFSKLFFVNFAQLQGLPNQLRKAFRNAVETVTSVMFPSALGIAVVAPELVRTLFGADWPLSGFLLRILAIVAVPLTMNVMAGTMVSAAGLAWTYLITESATAAIGMALLIGLAHFGIFWIALSILIREALAVAVYGVILRRCLGIRFGEYAGPAAHSLLMAGTMGGALLLFQLTVSGQLSDSVLLAVVTTLGVATYAILMLITRRPQVVQTILFVREGFRRTPGA